ncbi:MAG: TolC family protein [Planctomycetes bacterium]|nr:TolC family protein [Planctomycetota bacterium]
MDGCAIKLNQRISGACLAVCLACLALAGCPAEYRKEADRMAYNYIRHAQMQTFGSAKQLRVESPGDTLRRRLLLEQDLPISSKASFGSDRLEEIEHWPEKGYPKPPAEFVQPTVQWHGKGPLRLNLLDSLQVAARNNRDYQTLKEDVFLSALQLDLEDLAFRNTFAGSLSTIYDIDRTTPKSIREMEYNNTDSWSRKLKTGANLSARFMIDLVQLVKKDRDRSRGLYADATVEIPLMRGAAMYVVTESLTQAQRDVVYALYTMERYRQQLAVQVTTEYLGVLQQYDQLENAESNYRSLISATRRAKRLADAGRLPSLQVDQASQDELRARDRWVSAGQQSKQRLDSFKMTLGLPVDADVELDKDTLDTLATDVIKRLGLEAATQPVESQPAWLLENPDAVPSSQPASQPGSQPATLSAQDAIVLAPPSNLHAGPMEMDPRRAVETALKNRQDLTVVNGQVFDAQRAVAVAADALQADLTINGTAQTGERRTRGTATEDNARFRFEKAEGLFTAGAQLDLPWERTAERDAYRESFVSMERAVRASQKLEDQVKLEVRNSLRNLLQYRESFTIQLQAVRLAKRRVSSTLLSLEAGRAEIRDVLEAQEAFVSAQNALTASLVNYRLAELQLQRDMGVLTIDEKGLFSEYKP